MTDTITGLLIDLIALLIAVGGFLLFFGGMFLFAFWIGGQNCVSIGQKSSHPVDYRVFGGCFIEIDNNWVPLDNWRVFNP